MTIISVDTAEATGNNEASNSIGGDISPVSELSLDSSAGSGAALSILLSNMSQGSNIAKVEDFRALMYKTQAIRRQIVTSILSENSSSDINWEWVEMLRNTYNLLTDSNTSAFQREMLSACDEKFLLNVKDEIVGLQKDLIFLDHLRSAKEKAAETVSLKEIVWSLDFEKILEPHHPVSPEAFREEYEKCIRFLKYFIASIEEEGKKPIMITDWDGTMKDYCSQYATNLQPIYSAINMAQFAQTFTRLTAVLTAGPLRGPGILDLTALPIDGPVMFSGSWGREWWMGGKRVVHDDGISDEGIDALERLSDEMKTLLQSRQYSQFGMVGSGVQRKVDRLTLGIQTVCKHVHPDLSNSYKEEVLERVHRVDPCMQILHFDPSTDLEVEVVVKNNNVVWNKAHGVARVVQTRGDSLAPPGRILICGDTSSDLPMVQYAVDANKQGAMALFVGLNEELRKKVQDMIPDEKRTAFVSCPDVIHAAMMKILRETFHKNQQKSQSNDETKTKTAEDAPQNSGIASSGCNSKIVE